MEIKAKWMDFVIQKCKPRLRWMAGLFLLAVVMFGFLRGEGKMAKAYSQAGLVSPGAMTEEIFSLSQSQAILVGNPIAHRPAVSLDGRCVVFSGRYADVFDGNQKIKESVFLYDRYTSRLEHISFPTYGGEARGNSNAPGVSADGRYVVFQSDADNLVSGDTNEAWDIFLYDHHIKSLRRVSSAIDNAQADGNSFFPSISADGRRVTFVSYAQNLIGEDTNQAADVFVKDLQTGEVRLVSRNDAGEPANGASYQPMIAADGRSLVFVSSASNLISEDENGVEDVFLYDLENAKMHCVSEATNGSPANGASWYPALSVDGRYIAFASYASNLVADDKNGVMDVFLYDVMKGQLKRVSTSQLGKETDLISWNPAVSADGRYVVFDSLAEDVLNQSGTKGDSGILSYLYDSKTGQVRLLQIDYGAMFAEIGSGQASVLNE